MTISTSMVAGLFLFLVTTSASRAEHGHAPSHCAAPAGVGPPSRSNISETDARKQVLQRIQRRSIVSMEMECEDGRWIYTADVRVGKNQPIAEVQVDASSERILSVQTETTSDTDTD